MSTWKATTPTTVENLKACSLELLEDLVLFFKTLCCGIGRSSNDMNKDNIETGRLWAAMVSDAAFNVSRGSVCPWKQTVVGLGLWRVQSLFFRFLIVWDVALIMTR